MSRPPPIGWCSTSSMSPVHLRHPALAVARPGHLLRRECRIERRHLLRREPYVGRRDVLLEIFPPLGAGDRHHVVALVKQPRERDLRRRRSLPRREITHRGRGLHVRVEVLPLIARIASAEVVLGIFL